MRKKKNILLLVLVVLILLAFSAFAATFYFARYPIPGGDVSTPAFLVGLLFAIPAKLVQSFLNSERR